MSDLNPADFVLIPHDGEGEAEYVCLMMGGPTNAYIQPNGAQSKYAVPTNPYYGSAWPGNNPSQNVVRFFNDDACLYGTVLHHEDMVSAMFSLGYEKAGVHKVVVDRIIMRDGQSFDADLGDGRVLTISADYSLQYRVFSVRAYPKNF